MRYFNGTFALIGGFIGVVGMGYAIYNRTLDIPGVLLFGALIALGAVATWMRVTGQDQKRKKPKGPLSGK